MTVLPVLGEDDLHLASIGTRCSTRVQAGFERVRRSVLPSLQWRASVWPLTEALPVSCWPLQVMLTAMSLLMVPEQFMLLLLTTIEWPSMVREATAPSGVRPGKYQTP
jgi:hypothetical protein